MAHNKARLLSNDRKRRGRGVNAKAAAAKKRWWAPLGSPVFQNVILFFTLLGAVWIGIKQYKIGFKQNEINVHLLDLNYFPEIEATYKQPTAAGLTIANFGKAEVCVFGVGGPPPDPNKKVLCTSIAPGRPRDIAPQAGGTGLEPCVPHVAIPRYVYLKSQDQKKYTVEALFFCDDAGKLADNGKAQIGIPIAGWITPDH